MRRTAYQVTRMAHRWRGVGPVPLRGGHRIGSGPLGALLGLAGYALGQATGWNTTVQVLTVLAVALLAGTTGRWWYRDVAVPQSSRAAQARAQHLANRHGGLASRLDVAELASAAVLRRMAPVLAPSTRAMTKKARRRVDIHGLGVLLAVNGWGWWGQRLWIPNERAVLRIAGPRTGKTTSMIQVGRRAPGALVTTSTRLDLAEGVHADRDTQRVWVYDPGHACRPDAPVTRARWRVLTGCEVFGTACRRAEDLIPASNDPSGERWDTKARLLLGLLLHAAAVSGRTMNDVRDWANSEADTLAYRQVSDALEAVGQPRGVRARLAEWGEHCRTNSKTRTSVTSTMAAAVAWVSDDDAREIGDAPPDDPNLLDVRRLIVHAETLHLIGRAQGSRTAPLIAALVAEIAHQARAIAQTSPGGRLDPALTMLLDEAPLVCPVPLDSWTADMGGRAVHIEIAAQSRAQLQKRWGDDGSTAILSNCDLLVHGGSTDAAYLRDVSALIGDVLVQIDPDDRRLIPALMPARARELGKWQVIVMSGGLRPFVGRAPTVVGDRAWAPVPLGPLDPPDETTAQDQDQVVTTADLEALFQGGEQR